MRNQVPIGNHQHELRSRSMRESPERLNEDFAVLISKSPHVVFFDGAHRGSIGARDNKFRDGHALQAGGVFDAALLGGSEAELDALCFGLPAIVCWRRHCSLAPSSLR